MIPDEIARELESLAVRLKEHSVDINSISWKAVCEEASFTIYKLIDMIKEHGVDVTGRCICDSCMPIPRGDTDERED